MNKMDNFLISTTPILDGMTIEKYLGVVNTNIVIGTNLFSDIAASFTDVFGGNSGTYQGKMDSMYQAAKKELIARVKTLGGNAIVGFRADFDEISGKGKNMFMLSATGTACLVCSSRNNYSEVDNITSVDSFALKNEITKMSILKSLSEKKYTVLFDDKWQYILEYPSVEIAKLIVDKMYYNYTNEDKQKVENLLSRLDFEDAVAIVYPNYIANKIEKKTDAYGSESAESDVSTQYLDLIKNCNLFSPEKVIPLIDTDIDKALSLLECDKPFYTNDDLKCMRVICDKFEKLPDLGEKAVGKTGVFTKEKEIWVCPNGHKNSLVLNYCERCGVNMKGLTRVDTEKIEVFKRKTEALSKLLI